MAINFVDLHALGKPYTVSNTAFADLPDNGRHRGETHNAEQPVRKNGKRKLAIGPAAAMAIRFEGGLELKARCFWSSGTGPSRSSSIFT